MIPDAIELKSESNTRSYESLVLGGPPILRNVSDAFVLLEDLSWPQMKALISQYCDHHDQKIREFFLAPSIENVQTNSITRITKRSGPDMQRNLNAPFALKIETFDKSASPPLPKFEFVDFATVRQAMLEAGVKVDDPIRDFLNLDFSVQKRVGEHVLSAGSVRTMEWSKGSRRLYGVASERVAELALSAQSTLDFLQKICAPLIEWMQGSHTKGRTGNKVNRVAQPRRPFAIAWFAIWLAERGYILFPTLVGFRVNELIPIFWSGLRHAFISAGSGEKWIAMERDVAVIASPKGLADPDAPTGRGQRNLDGARVMLDFLRWNSTWRGLDQVSAQFLFEAFTRARGGPIPHNVRALWDIAKVGVNSISPEQMRVEDSKLRAQKARTRIGDEAGRAWPWVDDPNYKRYRPHERYSIVGFDAGPNMISHVRELRELLPKIVARDAGAWRAALALWLMFLASLPDETVPPGILHISRAGHIDDPADIKRRTFCRYIEEQSLPADLRNRVFYYLERAWRAAYELAPAEKRPSMQVCPVLTRFDAPRLKNRYRGQTHRRPLDEEILLLMISENRRDDFSFSKSRAIGKVGRKIDLVRVRDAATGEFGYQWFPGYAILMDVLLNIPLRKHQARYLDSGEGDEYALDIESLELSKNSLEMAESGRQQGFFRRYNTSLIEDRPVLGMFVNTNKTGRAYDVPWLPMDVARNVKRVIDWQLRFNAIEEPVPDHDYVASNRGGSNDGVRVWPIFRDPSDPSNTPISDQKLQSYFESLLAHCEKILKSRSGKDVSLFVEEIQTKGLGKGKLSRRPIIDIHSLRVTGVTVLIENGVPLEVVRLLVGHATIAMTCYYHVLESRKVHEDLMRALESRAPTIERLQAMTDSEYQEWSSKFAFNRSGEPELALSLIGEAIRQRTPGWDMKYHGICAGGDCRYGGSPEKVEGPPTPLWRNEACSVCRFRITGAPWLVGLVHHLNELWWELRECTKSIVELQVRRDSAEDAGVSIRSIGGELERAKIKRDNLMEEWVNELRYVEQAKRDLDAWAAWLDADSSGESVSQDKCPIPLRSPLEADGVKAQLAMVHQLSHMTELLRGARILPSAILPRGIKEDRNALLLDIARVAGIDMPFLRLPRQDAERALDVFADLLLDSVPDSDALEDLVGGLVSLNQYPALSRQVRSLFVESIEREQPLVSTRSVTEGI